jgi:hypothetical protein
MLARSQAVLPRAEHRADVYIRDVYPRKQRRRVSVYPNKSPTNLIDGRALRAMNTIAAKAA